MVGGAPAKLIQNDSVTSVDEFVLQDVKVFPNPAVYGFFNVDFPAGTKFPVNVQIYSASGALVFNKESKDNSATIKTDDFANGMYMLQIRSVSGIETRKLVIGN